MLFLPQFISFLNLKSLDPSKIIKIFIGNVQEVKFVSKQILIILLVILNRDKNLIHISEKQVLLKEFVLWSALLLYIRAKIV